MNRKVADYALALLLSLLALCGTYYIPALGAIPWTAAFIAVAAVAQRGGFGPAAFATMVSSLGTYAFIFAPGEKAFIDPTALIKTLVFDAGALFVAYLIRGHSKALSALRASEKHYRSVTETASDVIVTIDGNSVILSINLAAKRILGYEPKELVGKPLITLMPEEYRRAHLAGFNRHLKTGERHIPWSGVELSCKTKDGERLPVEISFGSYRVNGVVRFTGFIRDISDRRAVQDALVRSEKLAAVGRLASSIAHEINNPLEAITNLIYLGRASKDMEEVQTHLEIADREVRRMSVIVSQTLSFNKNSVAATQVDSSNLIREALSLFQARLVNSNVSVVVRDKARRCVVGAEGQIRQVLTNLIGNAIDALPPNGGRLLLRSRDATDWQSGRTGVVITVADSGIGISSETRAKIFEPFFTTKGIGGSGLGLWISCEIVEKNKGSLRVKSSQTSGRSGTVFKLFLPSS